MRPLVLGVLDVHQGEIVHHPFTPFRPQLTAPEHLVHGQLHVFEDGQPRQQRMVLEDYGPIRSGLADLFVLEEHTAAGRLHEPGDDVEQRGLAAARVADDGDELALLHAQADISKDLAADRPAAEGHIQVFDREVGMHGDRAPSDRAAAGDEIADQRDQSVEHKTDDADVEKRDNDVADQRRIPCIPNKETNAHPSREHLCRDDRQP